MALRCEDADYFLAHAHNYPVVLAVLNVWLPETSGLEVQARLNEGSPNTKVIVMTARETPAIRAAGLEGGAFVLKPFDDGTFLSLVRQEVPSAAYLRRTHASIAQPGMAQ